MKFKVSALVVGLAFFLVPLVAEAQQAVLVVRHAERLDPSEDSPLSDAGHRRAQALATLLKDAGVTTIYASDLQRTIKTAEPLAKHLRVAIRKVPQYDGRDMDRLVGRLRAQHVQDTVLIVGHSNTLPALIKGLGHPEEIKIGRDEYDLLLVVISKPEGRPVLLRLRF